MQAPASVSSATRTLNSGVKIPLLGLGVYKAERGEETRRSVLSALRLGYRHIDTAQFYQNEADVGAAVRQAAQELGVPREQVFVTSKLLATPWASGAAGAFDATLASVKQSVDAVGLGAIDLLLLHVPGAPDGRAEAWRGLEAALDEGLVRAIGVSNFGQPHLRKLLDGARVAPAVNQVELHPWLQWRELTAFCSDHGIVMEAYSPLAKGTKLGDPALLALAREVGRTPAQVLIRWSIQKGFVLLPKSVTPERQASNAEVFGWELSPEAMALLDSFEADLTTGYDAVRLSPV